MTEAKVEGKMEEALPVSEKLKVLDHVTYVKTAKWWAAAALIDSFGRKQVATYLWLNKAGKWKRQQKFVVRSKPEWDKIKAGIDMLVEKL